jgi:hypothetical protein
MKYVFLSAIISVLLSSSACKKSRTVNCAEPELNCAGIMCIAHWDYFDFKLTDKVSGQDLVFGSNPRYTESEVKLFYDAARTIQISITTDTENKKIRCMNARSEMYLEIKGTALYKLNAGFKAVDCCSNRVKSLQVNNILVCDCCAEIINVPVN